MSPARADHPALLALLGPMFGPGEIPALEPRDGPMFDTTQDVDTILRNIEKTFELKERQHRLQAQEIQAKLDGFQGELYAAQYRPQIRRALALADHWQARAAEARNGYFLFRDVEMGDGEFMREFTGVLNACQSQGRVVSRKSSEEQRIDQNTADGPYPDQ